MFVGPSPEAIEMFGDKTAARAFATKMDVPVLPGSMLCKSVQEAEAFLAKQLEVRAGERARTH